jgi:hypothetical protein
MSFYQIVYRAKQGDLVEDCVYETDSLSDAKYTAEHKIDGSYGETDLVSVVSVKRISRAKAEEIVYGGGVAWVNSIK